MTFVSAIVSGLVIFADTGPEIFGAVAHILVEEVTRADAPATLAARLEVPSLTLRPGHNTLRFSVKVEAIDPAKRYAVRVHVDVDRDGLISPGDYVSTESYPVLTRGAPDHVQVRVRRI